MFRALRTFKLNGRNIKRGELLDEVPAHLEGTFLRAKFIEPYDEAINLNKLTKPALMKMAGVLGVEIPSKMRVADIRELLKAEVS